MTKYSGVWVVSLAVYIKFQVVVSRLQFYLSNGLTVITVYEGVYKFTNYKLSSADILLRTQWRHRYRGRGLASDVGAASAHSYINSQQQQKTISSSCSNRQLIEKLVKGINVHFFPIFFKCPTPTTFSEFFLSISYKGAIAYFKWRHEASVFCVYFTRVETIRHLIRPGKPRHST